MAFFKPFPWLWVLIAFATSSLIVFMTVKFRRNLDNQYFLSDPFGLQRIVVVVLSLMFLFALVKIVQGHTLNTPNQAGETTSDPEKPGE